MTTRNWNDLSAYVGGDFQFPDPESDQEVDVGSLYDTQHLAASGTIIVPTEPDWDTVDHKAAHTAIEEDSREKANIIMVCAEAEIQHVIDVLVETVRELRMGSFTSPSYVARITQAQELVRRAENTLGCYLLFSDGDLEELKQHQYVLEER